MRGQAFIAATALAAMMAVAQPASAQQYRSYHDEHVYNQQQCGQSRQNRTAGGAVIGGVLGALLGREVADRGVRGEGAALGAVVGAVAGGAVGRSTARCNSVPQGSYDPYYGQAQQPYYGSNGQQPYYGDEDLYGGPYRQSDYRGQQDCRPGEIITRDRRGREYREQVMMCRGRDGVYRPE